eukprot:CAMPEP_0113657752 /NCGR_PEP_ID=MMETSP0017_2-20120614/31272_1 /TAXON_ID=2856 /ORGANISM="Cylindrotheca closterium" /LENGTH=210 /DNA_ID=CAMNT_0000571817 /DNA_START=573 /DNA_END=1203 /DNA_ORIENTATION=- /assembly_acc=CAM_ASM_000147
MEYNHRILPRKSTQVIATKDIITTEYHQEISPLKVIKNKHRKRILPRNISTLIIATDECYQGRTPPRKKLSNEKHNLCRRPESPRSLIAACHQGTSQEPNETTTNIIKEYINFETLPLNIYHQGIYCYRSSPLLLIPKEISPSIETTKEYIITEKYRQGISPHQARTTVLETNKECRRRLSPKTINTDTAIYTTDVLSVLNVNAESHSRT